MRTRRTYRRQDALGSDLVVLDGFVPADGLPPAPAVALIDPPRIPGGLVGAPLPVASVSSAAAGNDLIAGVDLRSLSIDRNAARQLKLPSWFEPVVSSPRGTLLAAGDNGRQRVAVLAFDPPNSNLTQLPAFPILARNLERWASGWTSAGANGTLAIDSVPGTTRATVISADGAARSTDLKGRAVGITGLAPGAYTVAATGAGVSHRTAVVAALPVQGTPARATDGPIDLRPWARRGRAARAELAQPVSDRAGTARDRRRMGLLALAQVADVNARDLGRRISLAGVAAVLGALAAVAALSDPHTGSRAERAVIAVDRSASVDAAMRSVEGRWIGRATPDGCVVPCRIVSFGARADALPPGPADSVTSRATDLEGGVAAAVAAAPRGGRVVVLSDGLQTAGDASRAVAAARARNVKIDAVPLTDDTLRDAALIRLDAPAAVHQGDTISLLVTVHSTSIDGAVLSVTRDGGSVASQNIRLVKGDNPFTLSYTAASEGWHAFRVGVRLAGDERPQNNELVASVDVGAPPQAIVASVSPNPAIARILQERGVRPIVAQPASLPTDPVGYATIDAVVLDDVPADLLGTTQLNALSTAVRDGGLGLLTLGGRHAYSLGGYARSALDRVLPVASLSPGDLQRRHLAVELVLDRSGSMADTAGGEGIPKMTMALSAATQTATFVSDHADELGITAFDIAPHLVLPMQRITPGPTTERVQSTISRLTADGGTDIYLGLRAGLQEVLKSQSPNRHIILLTDGISQPHNYTALLQDLKRDHIAVATVALGTDVDAALLKNISDSDRRQLLRDEARARPPQDLRQGDAPERRARADQWPAGRAAAGLEPGRALARRRQAAVAQGQRRDPPAPRRPGGSARAQRRATRRSPRSRSGATAPAV